MLWIRLSLVDFCKSESNIGTKNNGSKRLDCGRPNRSEAETHCGPKDRLRILMNFAFDGLKRVCL